MSLFKTACAVGLIALSSGVCADVFDQFQERLTSYRSFTAEFDQVTRGQAVGGRKEINRGRVELQPPGNFRWETVEPYPQLIVGNQQAVWIYEPDLEQATKKSVNAADGSVPGYILSGNTQALRDCCALEVNDLMGEGNEIYWLTPKREEGNLKEMTLSFEQGNLAELKIIDRLDQATLVLFKNPQLNATFPVGYFEFEPPEGTDVMVEPGAE